MFTRTVRNNGHAHILNALQAGVQEIGLDLVAGLADRDRGPQ
ncbi:MAG: hypothetical protein ACR2F6_13885 [Mycobacteriales bacterium]